MAIRIVELGSRRLPDEGVRIGTVRRPPRLGQGWGTRRRTSPALRTAPWEHRAEAVKLASGATSPAEWEKFARRYRAEMKLPDAAHTIELLAALSHQSNFSVGCYCQDESRCHRSILKKLLMESGATVNP